MAKVIFVLHRRAEMTREQCLEHWSSEQHTSILIESDDAMDNAVNSPEMAAAIEHAQNFLDLEKTGMIFVEEKTVVR